MKSLRKDTILDRQMLDSTYLERTILLQANHPFLVGMDYVFQSDYQLFFVMQFVRGGELFTHLKNFSRFPESQVKFFVNTIAVGIGFLHSQNIVYRDIKTENILMGEDGYICLTDFGLAKIVKEDRMANTYCGTPDYMAPEILNH